jgi:serine/threonine-protein kinase HipA
MLKSAFVYYDGKLAGLIEKNQDGYVFEYSQDYLDSSDARPVSLTMPLQKKRFEAPKLFPFFEGLLPEGWLLNITSHALKIDKEDKFELLLHIGKDTIGAISIIPKEDNAK